MGLLAALGMLAALAACVGPPAAQGQPLRTGITNLGDNEPIAWQRAHSAGANFVRISLSWEVVAPAAPPASWDPGNPADPNYNWTDVDVATSRAVAAGLTPVLLIEGAPPWAQRCATPPVLPDATCDPDPGALAVFAAAAARRYGGGFGGLPRVRYWQILNEPNLSLFFFPQFNTAGKVLSAALYRKALNASYAAIKAVDPSNLVLSSGLGPIAVPKWTVGPLRFTRDLLCMKGHNRPRPKKGNCGGGVSFDIFAIQPYTTQGPSYEGNVNDVPIGGLGKLQRLLRAADRAGRTNGAYRRTPLWITEFSWDSQPPDPGGLPDDILNRWVAEAMHEAWTAGVSHFFWYSLRDGGHPAGSSYSNTLESGLYFRGATVHEDRPKPVLSVFRFPFVAYATKRGLTFWGRTPTSEPGRVVIQARRGNGWRRVGVARATKAGVFRGRSGSRYGRGRRGYVRALFKGNDSVPFSMKPVPNFRHPPFG